MGYAAAAVTEGVPFRRDSPWRRRASLGVAAAVVLLALSETVSALVAPLRAPNDADWAAAETQVRAGFRPGDLIVAAPAWSDQAMRLRLGDLIPLRVAARLDDARFGRVWQISQRGAVAPEVAVSRQVADSRHGALRVSLFERTAARVTYDFVEQWAQAHVFRFEPGRGDIACQRLPDRHQCPNLPANFVLPRVLEADATLHRGLYTEPVQGAAVVVQYNDVPLGRELAIGHGLHDPWWRRLGDGTVWIKVLINGKPVGEYEAGNRTGWRILRIDTRAWAGAGRTVRFEIRSAKPYARHYGFAAEARD